MFLLLLAVALPVIVSSARFVSYIDKIEGWWPDSDILKAWGVPGYTSKYAYNVLNLAFLQSSIQPSDALDPWVDPTKFFSAETMQNMTGSASPTDDQFRSALKKLYQSANVKVMVSCFGAGDYPTRSKDPTSLGKQIGDFVIKYQLDGVDIDWEESAAFQSGDGVGENWLATLTSSMRATLGSKYLISHAPQAPYFMGTATYKAGGYLAIQNKVGSQIDWYNIQFYNQGTSAYNTYQSLFVASEGWSTNSSVFQIMNGNNDLKVKTPSNKIVVGKPVSQGDADNTGYVAPSSLESIFGEAVKQGWNAGFMDWQFSSDLDQGFRFANTVSAAFH